eukprot:13495128-Alexandrium_andersonii.AAC.1
MLKLSVGGEVPPQPPPQPAPRAAFPAHEDEAMDASRVLQEATLQVDAEGIEPCTWNRVT